jgi:hypothetical protein
MPATGYSAARFAVEHIRLKSYTGALLFHKNIENAGQNFVT